MGTESCSNHTTQKIDWIWKAGKGVSTESSCNTKMEMMELDVSNSSTHGNRQKQLE